MFVAAARVLSEFAPLLHDSEGSLYPPLEKVRDISFKVALEVAREALRAGLAEEMNEADLENAVKERMCQPHYVLLRQAVVDRYQMEVEGICSW
jgi:malate dehydrogenase (oxaloacetate-decarboxylating)